MPRRGIMRLLRDRIVPRPVIVPRKCTRCGQCVEVCPTDPKSVGWIDAGRGGRDDRKQPPRHHYATCIRCYCCQEICPEGAIVIRTPLLGRLMPR
jgi:formate hydrogenlyase subunit 6/NADH:ubiquinone oxidoreductase subunit I